jgi:hypothetical protein
MNDTLKMSKTTGYAVDSQARAPGDRWITMSNALVRAGHGLALSEKRLVAIAISKLDSVKAPALGLGGRVPRINVTAAEYAELAEVASSAAYEALEKAGTALMRDAISMYEPEWLRRKRRSKKTEGAKPVVVKMPWVITSKYVPNEARIEMEFHPDVVPFLLGLKKQFTSYQLKQTSSLRSVYSWRLLELLSRFKSTGVAEYTIEEFRVSMDVPDGLSDFSQVKRRVIDPAIKELQEKDGWKIELELIKGGKRVKALRFQFRRDPQGTLEGFGSDSNFVEPGPDDEEQPRLTGRLLKMPDWTLAGQNEEEPVFTPQTILRCWQGTTGWEGTVYQGEKSLGDISNGKSPEHLMEWLSGTLDSAPTRFEIVEKRDATS